jgi:hypothetical protein
MLIVVPVGFTGETLFLESLMEQALRTPGFYSGVGGEGVKRANQFLTALGVRPGVRSACSISARVLRVEVAFRPLLARSS